MSRHALSSLGSITLASGSPARLQVLRELGLEVDVCPTQANEDHCETDPATVVSLLAKRKMESFLDSHPHFRGNALACDTLISFQGRLIGKPRDEDDARKQLRLLSGNTHQVFTGYCLVIGSRMESGCDVAGVRFKALSSSQIESYIQSDEYKGAAGSYRIQGMAKTFIDGVDGDPYTVIGIPVEVLDALI